MVNETDTDQNFPVVLPAGLDPGPTTPPQHEIGEPEMVRHAKSRIPPQRPQAAVGLHPFLLIQAVELLFEVYPTERQMTGFVFADAGINAPELWAPEPPGHPPASRLSAST